MTRFAALALLLFAGLLGAQTSETGLVRGHVTDYSRVPLAGVELTIARSDGSYRRTSITDAVGVFYLSLLPPGHYTLRARRFGYRPVVMTDVRVDAGVARVMDLALTAAPTELEAVTVRGESPVEISRSDAASNTKITSDELQTLPVGFELDRVVALTPGARPDQLWGGASVQANGYLLDGVAFNNPGSGGVMLEPSLSWAEEVEVRGLGAGAQYGSFQGGVVNVVTKSGSNSRQGALHTYIEHTSEAASSLTSSEITPEVASRRQIDAELRGPIVRDRLFYFVAGQLLATDWRAVDHLDPSARRFAPVQQNERDLKLFAKGTWNASPRDLVNLTVGYARASARHFELSGRESAEATLRRNAPASLASSSWQHSFGRDSYLDARILVHAADDRRTPSATRSVPAIQTYELANYRQFQNALFSDRFAPRTTAGSVSWRRAFDQGSWTERVRAGADASEGGYFEQHVRTGGMTWRPRYAAALDPADPQTWSTNPVSVPTSWGGETHLSAGILNSAVWVEDDFTAGRFTISRGIRFGTFEGRIANAGGGRRIPVWRATAWDPRAGVVIDLSPVAARDVPPTFTIKAHWGRFHQHLFAQMFDRAAGSNVYSDQELWDYHGTLPADPRIAFTVDARDALAEGGTFTLVERASLSQTGVISNIRQPYMDEWIAGLEHTIGSRWKIEALYVHRSNRDAVALIDRNRDVNYTLFRDLKVWDHLNRPVLAPNGTPLVIPELYVRNDAMLYVLRNANDVNMWSIPGFDRIDTLHLSYDPSYELANVPDLRREFRQAQVNVSASYATWRGTFSLAWTDLHGNQASITGYDAQALYGRDDVAGRGPGQFVRRNESGNSFGWLENFTPWEGKVRVSGNLPFGFTGGAFLLHRIGDRTGATFTISRLGFRYSYSGMDTSSMLGLLLQPITGERIYVEPRGSRHYGDNTQLDLRVERTIPTGALALTVDAEAVNVLGSTTPTLVNTALESQSDVNASTHFADVLDRVPPRSFRIGASVRF